MERTKDKRIEEMERQVPLSIKRSCDRERKRVMEVREREKVWKIAREKIEESDKIHTQVQTGAFKH